MSVSVRPILVPAVAIAAAGAVALGPALVAPPAVSVAVPAIPAVHIQDVQLAGIGQDIYYAITPWVQYGVELAQYAVGWIPLIGPPIAEQIYINYFLGIQPIVEATVNYLASVVQDPFNFIAETGAYGNQLYGIGYNWVVQQFNFFFPWLPPLPPLPPVASVSAPTAAASHRVSAAAAVVADPEAPVEVAPVADVEPAPVADVEPQTAVDPVIAEVAPAVEAEVSDSAPVAVGRAGRVAAAVEVAAPAEATASQPERPSRAVRGEGRDTGKAARATRSAAE